MKISKIGRKHSWKDLMYKHWPAYNFWIEIIIAKFKEKEIQAKPLQNSAKLDETIAKKQSNLLSLRGWQRGEIPLSWRVIMKGDKKWSWFLFSVSTYSQKPIPIQSRQNQRFGCFAEEWLKNQSSNIDSFRYRLTVLPTHPGRQAIRSSPYLSFIYFHERVYSNQNPINVFPEKEMCGLSPNSYIHVSVSYLYILTICPYIWLQQNRQIDPGNI
jgi:hypothetical protein